MTEPDKSNEEQKSEQPRVTAFKRKGVLLDLAFVEQMIMTLEDPNQWRVPKMASILQMLESTKQNVVEYELRTELAEVPPPEDS